MTSHRIFGVAIPLTLLIAAIIFIPGKGQEQKTQRKFHPKPFDENRLPIADYSAPEPSDPSEREKRKARGKKYDKSDWNIYPNTQSNMARVDAVNPHLPALPVAESSAIVMAEVTDASAYLSNDKTGVYSVFKLDVKEVLKNSSKFPISTTRAIEVERDGGRVKFSDGRVLLYSISSQHMPGVGLRYVLFLANPRAESDFQIVTGYELRDGKVDPLDDLPNPFKYKDVDEAVFLTELRNELSKR